jgi:predicted TPR repeat methyltransferase
MPTSKYKGKELIVSWIKEHADIHRVLDVGCGEGTYPRLLKEKFPVLADAEWWGIEVWTDYIERYDLNSLYDHILNQDARELDWSQLPEFDLVIFGDVLEHMTKEQSQALVDRALTKAKYVVISIPIHHCPQGAWGGNPYEIHVKDDWTHQEVMESFPGIKQFLKKTKTIGVYWIEK